MVDGTPFAVIELNDSEIRVAKGADIILRSPGYAIVSKDRIELGSAAVRQARLNPRAMQNRYWHDLNQIPLPAPTARIRHHADLAYAHLLAIHAQAGKPEDVLFAVPGHYLNEQLSLLLGLVEASPFNAIGLVDAAVAAAASQTGPGTYVHAEIHLHQTVLTHIDITHEVNRSSVQVIDGAGLACAMDDCAAMISELFIKQSRFDPQHHAETEQSLYDQIPQCLLALGLRPEVVIEIPYQKTTYLAKLPRQAMIEALQPLYRKISAAMPAAGSGLVGDRLAGLPGFVEQLNAARASAVQVLAPDSVFQGCRQHIDSIRSSGPALNFVTRLPAAAGPSAVSTARAGSSAAATSARSQVEADNWPVTHILSAYRAYPLTSRPLYLSALTGEVSDNREHAHCSVSSTGGRTLVQAESGLAVILNGQHIDTPASVRAGDIMSFAGAKTEYTFINVKN